MAVFEGGKPNLPTPANLHRLGQARTALAAADPRGVKGTRHSAVAVLARARAQRDLTACEEAVAAFHAGVAKERASSTGTGGMNSYDWLEVALTVHTDLPGQRSSRLRPVEHREPHRRRTSPASAWRR